MKYLSAKSILSLEIEQLPKSQMGVLKRSKAENWPCKELRVEGSTKPVKHYLLPDKYLPAVAVKSTSTELSTASLKDTDLSDWQRECAVARAEICRLTLELSESLGKAAAVKQMINSSMQGGDIATLAARAKAKKHSKTQSKLSASAIYRWLADYNPDAKVGEVAAVAPKPLTTKVPAWAPLLLKAYAQPAKPDLSVVVRQVNVELKRLGAEQIQYHQARYFLTQHMGEVSKNQGRVGSRKLKEMKPFVRRDTSVLLPTDVYTADGHTFDAEVAHPIHGQPFRPEITTVMDVATRAVVGFSVDLAESSLAVLDAIRCSVTGYGVPAIFYVDNGSGYKNALMTAEGTGLMHRIGTQMKHSLPYNSQARGGIERIHQSIWIPLAKELPTYIGRDMDAQASNRAHKLTRKMIKLKGDSKILVGWFDFIDACHRAVEAYNHRPHTSLPRRFDESQGRRVNLSPAQAWKEMSEGHEIVKVEGDVAIDIFRPHVERKVRRGEVELFGNRYFARELEEYHDQTMQIGYDIHDADQVWVRDDQARLVAVAKFEANKVGFFPRSAIEAAREGRTKNRLARIEVKRQEALAEGNTAVTIEHLDKQRAPEAMLTKAQASLNAQLLKAAEDERAAAELKEWHAKREQRHTRHLQTLRGDFEPAPLKVVKGRHFTQDKQEEVTEQDPWIRWKKLDATQKSGTELSESDSKFWELYQHSKAYKMNQDKELTEFAAQLAQKNQN